MKKICIVLGSRANYSSIKSAMFEIKNHENLILQLVVCASALLPKYGSVDKLICEDGFEINEYLYTLIEGENPLTMAKSTGLGLIELSSVFSRIKPDIVMVIGDRFETMSTTLAAAYMNIPIAHTMGGEVSGTIDESIRHAITKFSHIHFAASESAKERIIKLGEQPETVYKVGCPRIDLVSNILKNKNLNLKKTILNLGVGKTIDLEKKFLLVSQHPVTTEYGYGEDQINKTLLAIRKSKMQAIILWPNADAGSDSIAKGIRKAREKGMAENMQFFKNLPIETYVLLMKNCSCLIGNSSSGIREGAFIGTPVVNIGSRQSDRERGKNVVDVDHNSDEILNAIKFQLEHGPYDSEDIYGDGFSGNRIAKILSSINDLSVQKTISF